MRNKSLCEKCGRPLTDTPKCETCNFVPHGRSELWKPANMGKQRIKPIANRTGKKQSGQPKLHHH